MVTGGRGGRDLRQRRVLDEKGGGVDADAGDAAIEPEAEDLLVLATNVRVIPVQVWLVRREEVEVPLARAAVRVGRASPRRTREIRRPARRHLVAVNAAARVEPEPRPLRRSGTGGKGGLEPGVPVRDVIGDDIDDRADPELERLADQGLGLGQGAEGRVDRAIVGDVVAPVLHRRRVPRGEPHGVDAEVTQVRELRADPGQVADPVAVRVGKAPDVDLIDDRVAPPLVVASWLWRLGDGRARSLRRRLVGQNPFGQLTFLPWADWLLGETVWQRR